ncbi:MAG: hypothetical protein EBT84_03500 [Sphingomonadaceae bacterium]|nr:hypothetical protein [Sphingomonadaceae bacterium]
MVWRRILGRWRIPSRRLFQHVRRKHDVRRKHQLRSKYDVRRDDDFWREFNREYNDDLEHNHDFEYNHNLWRQHDLWRQHNEHHLGCQHDIWGQHIRQQWGARSCPAIFMDFLSWHWSIVFSRSARASGTAAAIDWSARLNAWQVAPCPA